MSRHLTDDFLRRSDWDLTILHFLGLDHIGHLAGPSSPLVGPKLDEMGRIIQNIKEILFEKSKDFGDDELPPLILVLGDHGMADVGGHGGATPAEILVPVVAISPNINRSKVLERGSINNSRLNLVKCLFRHRIQITTVHIRYLNKLPKI